MQNVQKKKNYQKKTKTYQDKIKRFLLPAKKNNHIKIVICFNQRGNKTRNGLMLSQVNYCHHKPTEKKKKKQF